MVAALASRLIVMRNGKVVEEGPAAELFKNPKSDYTRALFAAAFNLETAPRWRRGAIALSRGAILLAVNGPQAADYERILRDHFAGRDIRVWPDQVGDNCRHRLCCVWRAPHGLLAQFPI